MKRLLPGAVAAMAAMAAMVPATFAASPAPDGAAVYDHWCAPCHSAGRGNPGTDSLTVKYKGQRPAVLLERTDLAPQAIAAFVRTGILSMPPFRKTEITDAELAALSAYVAKGYKP
jgi:mono/diheme cytochrome c family protein